VLYYFTAESGKIEEIEREIKLQDRVIRYLLTQQTTPLMEPTPAEGEVAEEAGEGEATEAAQPAATVSTAEGEAATETAEQATETAEQATETAEPATETAEQASDTEAPVE
jgi:hypothetical protein